MGKTTFTPVPDLSQRLLAAFGFGSVEIDPTNAFIKSAGVKDTRKDSKPEVSGHDLK